MHIHTIPYIGSYPLHPPTPRPRIQYTEIKYYLQLLGNQRGLADHDSENI